MSRRSGVGCVDVHHRLADLLGEVELGAGEAFRGVLVDHLGVRAGLRILDDALGPGLGDGDDALAVEAEDHPALQLRGGVVEVDDHPPRAGHRLEGAVDQVVARLGQHLDGDVLGDRLGVDQKAQEIVVGLRGGGEADLDLLEADADQLVEQPLLAVLAHRLDERLVAVAQIDAAPHRRLGDDRVRPGAVVQADGFGRPVLAGGGDEHGWVLGSGAAKLVARLGVWGLLRLRPTHGRRRPSDPAAGPKSQPERRGREARDRDGRRARGRGPGAARSVLPMLSLSDHHHRFLDRGGARNAALGRRRSQLPSFFTMSPI